jgi:hypothetical protein
MVRAGGGAGRPADMAKSSEWRTYFGRFWLRRGTGFAGLDGRKDCAMPGTETGESKSTANGFPDPFRSRGGGDFSIQGAVLSKHRYAIMRDQPVSWA